MLSSIPTNSYSAIERGFFAELFLFTSGTIRLLESPSRQFALPFQEYLA